MTNYDTLRRDINERVGDHERDITCNELVRHFSDGRLSEPEMQERTESALSARTRGDLYALLSDLPRTSEPARPVQPTLRRHGVSAFDALLGFFSISAVICFMLLTFMLSMTQQSTVILLFLGALAGSVATFGITHFARRGNRQMGQIEEAHSPPNPRTRTF